MLFNILRGIPGSSKSTIARKLANDTQDQTVHLVRDSLDGNLEGRYLSGLCGAIVSTDLYFLNDAGEYVFDGAKLGEYHSRNLEMCRQLMEDETSQIILDNTNVKLWHFLPYLEMGLKMGYEVRILEMPKLTASEACRRNIHRVPLAAIEAMISGYDSLSALGKKYQIRYLGRTNDYSASLVTEK